MTRRRLLKQQSLYLALSLMIVGLFPGRAVAWGSNGHRVIARIAMDRLSSSARQAVSQLLGPGETLESVSVWADTIKPQRPDTKNWHIVNIPLKYNNYRAARDCRQGCLISAIEQQTTILRNANSDPKQRADALKFLVHLIGDLHQPFHVATNTDPDDAGANLVKVISINGRQTNLHAVWDDDLINYALNQSHLSPTEYAAQLANKFRRGSANQPQVGVSSISTQGSVTDWALEAHRLAWGAYVPSDSYFMIRDNKVWKLDSEYYKRNLPVVEAQLVRAGARLAKILNEIFSAKSVY